MGTKDLNLKLRIKSTLPPELDLLIQKVIGIAIEVHTALGPGYIETIYERAMCYELDNANISYLRQIDILVPYKDINIPGQRLDLLIEKQLILELKLSIKLMLFIKLKYFLI